jgi:hypothetical protein
MGGRSPSAGLLTPRESLGEPVEAPLPKTLKLCEPRLKLAEPLGPKGKEPPHPVQSDPDEARFAQDEQMPRHAPLVNAHSGNDVAHGLLTPLQRLNNQGTCGIGQGLKEVDMHHSVYL